ncbi:DUF7857 domain-containing protein [Halorussus marinus]|uniref:DUF7857 domain-containing protein n=1 Tax=Halorussus marinus TaxID=2505976 RepID=UPI0010926CF9|nr:hypothetical protein [Halorussus marinus]
MVDLDWRVEAQAGVSLVELTVHNPGRTARRVRVANRLDGAVWPPRREGVAAAGWDDGGFEGVVAAGGRRALGYASPAAPTEPPAEVVWTERAGVAEPADRSALRATPDGVVRTLGAARPPADAVPRPTEPDPVPDAVESWLGALDDRSTAPTAAEREALEVVARRAGALADRSADERPSPGDSR